MEAVMAEGMAEVMAEATVDKVMVDTAGVNKAMGVMVGGVRLRHTQRQFNNNSRGVVRRMELLNSNSKDMVDESLCFRCESVDFVGVLL